jgi:hypothetical protein
MVGEIVAFVVLLAGVALFGALAWRLTLHLIGFDPQELAMWTKRLRERDPARPRRDSSSAGAAMPATPNGLVERVDRILAMLDD